MTPNEHRVTSVDDADAVTAAVGSALPSAQRDGIKTAAQKLLDWTDTILVETQTKPTHRIQFTATKHTAEHDAIESNTMISLTPEAVSRSGVVGTGSPTIRCEYAAGHDPAVSFPQQIALATQPAAGEDRNGDGAIIAHTGGTVLCGVVDGLGHGPHAADASAAALSHLQANATNSMTSLFDGVDAACRETRGVVAALATIDYEAATGRFGSVGNIEWRVEGIPFSLLPRRGIIGTGALEPAITEGDWPTDSKVVLYSDGVQGVTVDTIGPEPTPATAVLERYGRAEDDATVLTILPDDD